MAEAKRDWCENPTYASNYSTSATMAQGTDMELHLQEILRLEQGLELGKYNTTLSNTFSDHPAVGAILYQHR